MAKIKAAVRISRAAAIRNQRKLRFSLQYLQLDHPRFVLHECDRAFFVALFEVIARYQQFTIDEFEQPTPEEHRHPIFFNSSRVPGGFPHIDPASDPALWTDSPWQFGIPGQETDSTWRVHGFIDGVTFYIVWLDPHHHLFDRNG